MACCYTEVYKPGRFFHPDDQPSSEGFPHTSLPAEAPTKVVPGHDYQDDPSIMPSYMGFTKDIGVLQASLWGSDGTKGLVATTMAIRRSQKDSIPAPEPLKGMFH